MGSPKGLENRIHPRYEGVIGDYAVFQDSIDRENADYKPVFVRNFSRGGACFFLDEKVNRNHRIVIRLYDAYKVEPIEALAGIVWIQRSPDSPGDATHYDLGIRIIYIDEENEEKLEKLIQYCESLKTAVPNHPRNI